MAVVRSLLMIFVLWMLTGWNLLQHQTLRPELAIVVDTSASMSTQDEHPTTVAAGSGSRLAAVVEALNALPGSLTEDVAAQYQVRYFTTAADLQEQPFRFGQEQVPALQADGDASRLGENLIRVIQRQTGRGSAAVLFLSDGINNAGLSLADAERTARSAAVPVFAVSVGRDYALPEVRIGEVMVESDVFLGDRVTAQVAVGITGRPQQPVRLALYDEQLGQQLDSVEIDPSVAEPVQSTSLSFVAERSGTMGLRIELEPVEGEIDLSNNVSKHEVQVQDRPIRVLLVQQQPTYEFRFLKHLLERSMESNANSSASFELVSVLQEADAEYVRQDLSAGTIGAQRQRDAPGF